MVWALTFVKSSPGKAWPWCVHIAFLPPGAHLGSPAPWEYFSFLQGSPGPGAPTSGPWWGTQGGFCPWGMVADEGWG